jgi:ribosomal protein S18 acetylase RimI-like enzyme
LVRRALAGFSQAGLRQAYLEVTAENVPAVQLYRNVGFRRAKTLYKAIDD